MININHSDCVKWCIEYRAKHDAEPEKYPLFDSCVTDPPYELGFMGKKWDNTGVAFAPETWVAIFNILKDGAHIVAFSGTRTYHRMAVAIEDAGFEIRDQLAWIYGSGFPKSHDISKAIDKANGVEREKIRVYDPRNPKASGGGRDGQEGATRPWIEKAMQRGYHEKDSDTPASQAAKQWDGWGSALKPAQENICWAQKPHNLSQLCNILVQKIMEGLCQLPSIARDAEKNSLLSQSVFVEEFDSAQWSAVVECNTLGDLLGLMGMLQSELAIPTSLSTALSWLSTLVEVLKLESMFTIEMEKSLIIDLKTLKSLLSKNTPSIIIEAATQKSGQTSPALLVTNLFNAVLSRLSIIRDVSALENVILEESDWGTRPNANPICLARKPISEKSIAANVLKHGTGAINIDACRIGDEEIVRSSRNGNAKNTLGIYGNYGGESNRQPITTVYNKGRFPANIIHDGSDEVLAGFPETGAASGAVRCNKVKSQFGFGGGKPEGHIVFGHEDNGGSAARFFYSAKAGPLDRLGSKHPTIKPIDLMRWLCKLITPTGGHILEPFAGSGSTGIAAMADGFDCTMIDMEADHVADIERKIAHLKGEGQSSINMHKERKAEKLDDLGGLFA